VPANIAEGYERNHKKEYQQYLFIAKGSLGEVETYLLLDRDLQYITQAEYDAIEDKRAQAARVLIGLIKSIH
jgi:four helix bundle protein